MSDKSSDSSLNKSDVKNMLEELDEDSSSPDRIKSILRIFLVSSSENEDIGKELVDKGAVEKLISLLGSKRGALFKTQIANILLSLSFGGSGNGDKDALDIVITALSGIVSKHQSVPVFVECVSGINAIVIPLADSSTGSPHPSSSSPAAHSLSASSSAALLEHVATFFSSSLLKERAKLDVLDAFLQLVGTGAMNEAMEFLAWRRKDGQDGNVMGGGSGSSGSRGGSSTNGGNSVAAAVRLGRAFEAFAGAVGKMALENKMGAFYSAIKDVNLCLKENRFFPTFVVIACGSTQPEKQLELPLRFQPPSASGVTNTGIKITWTSSGYRTFYVDPEMNSGHYKITMEVKDNGTNTGNGQYGLAVKSLLGSLHNTNPSTQKSGLSGTCVMYFNSIICGGTAVASYNCFPNHDCQFGVALEFDADRHILYFFVDGRQHPHCVVNVPASVHFVMAENNARMSIELKTFTKLVNPTVSSSLVCTQHQWV